MTWYGHTPEPWLTSHGAREGWQCAICLVCSRDGLAHDESCPSHPQARLIRLEKRVAALEGDIVLAFALTTHEQDGHPHRGYTHRCDVTLLGKLVFSRWGRSPEEAERNARSQISARTQHLFARPA